MKVLYLMRSTAVFEDNAAPVSSSMATTILLALETLTSAEVPTACELRLGFKTKYHAESM